MIRGTAAVAVAASSGVGLAGCATGLAGVPATPFDAAGSSLDAYFSTHGAGGFTVNRYILDLAYDPEPDLLSGTVSVVLQPFSALSGLSLDCTGPVVHSVTVNGAKSAFTQHPATGVDKVHISPSSPLPAGSLATITLAYSVQPGTVQVPGIGPVGWFSLGEQPTDGAAVLSMPIGAPTWFPCADHPTLKAAYDLTLTVPNGLSVVGNGRLVSMTTPADSSTTTWHYRHDGPMATYLATLQAGNFQLATESGPNGIQLRNAYPAAIADAAAYDLGRQDQIIRTFSGLYGDYPFDVYGSCIRVGLPVRQYSAQTLGLLADTLIDGRRTNELDVAVGIAQQWFGSSCSVARWTDYWQASGMPLHAAWVWSERSGGPSAMTLARQAVAKLATLPQDIVPTNPGPNNLTAPQVSLRTACYLQALREELGDEAFFNLMRLWAKHGNGGFQGYDDWVQLIPAVYGGIDSVTAPWLHSSALPTDVPWAV